MDPRPPIINSFVPDVEQVPRAYLRSLLGDFYDAHITDCKSSIDWVEWWNAIRLPRSDYDLPWFFLLLARTHQAGQFGSYELQIIISALNRRHDFKGSSLQSEMKKIVSDCSELTDQFKTILCQCLENPRDLYEEQPVHGADSGKWSIRVMYFKFNEDASKVRWAKFEEPQNAGHTTAIQKL